MAINNGAMFLWGASALYAVILIVILVGLGVQIKFLNDLRAGRKVSDDGASIDDPDVVYAHQMDVGYGAYDKNHGHIEALYWILVALFVLVIIALALIIVNALMGGKMEGSASSLLVISLIATVAASSYALYVASLLRDQMDSGAVIQPVPGPGDRLNTFTTWGYVNLGFGIGGIVLVIGGAIYQKNRLGAAKFQVTKGTGLGVPAAGAPALAL